MTLIVGTPIERSNGATFTVPTGVTSGMVGLILTSTADSTNTGQTLVKTGATIAQLDGRAANNTYVRIYRATGLVAGDTVTVTQTAAGASWVQHFYQDEYDFVGTPAVGTRGGVSQAFCVTGSLTPAVGQQVAVVAVERTTATGTTVSSVASSGGETVTAVSGFYAENPTSTASTGYAGLFTASAAAARTVTVTHNSASGNGYAALILTEPLTVPNEGVPVKRTSATDTLADGALFYTSATDELATPLEVRGVSFGYATVDAMLAADPFYMAHRGGSGHWPEMSLHAYTQAAYWGVGALEVSVGRSSDGVFFGLHDATLDRTSGVTGVTASTLTWAAIQASYQISASLPAGQTAKPYMRLEELFDAYYGSHVLFIDPKLLTSPQRLELLDLMDAQPGDSTDHLVWKYFGVSSTFAPQGSARGYQTWGYFYESDLANLAANQAQWSILGMEHTALQTTWDTILAYGKPVIGHIVANSTQATAALTKGAAGMQVSGIQTVVPRA